MPGVGNDPAPANVAIYYRRQQQSSANALAAYSGETSEADVTGGVDNLQRYAQATSSTPGTLVTSTPPPVYDPAFVRRVLSLSGNSTQVSFTLSGSFNATATQNQANEIDGTKASATLACYVDLCVEGVDLGRFGGPLKSLGGNHSGGATDPTYTRWLPLAFSPQMTSQPFRTQASSVLPAPWGNINCAYSIGIAQEPNPPNYDLDGVYLAYIPTLGSDGHFDHGFGPFQTQPGPFIPQYAITDANGDRLVFDANWNPYENVHSTLVVGTGLASGTFQLTNAGPPGHLRDKGRYTYNFSSTSVGSAPLTARLYSIADDLGNTQTLSWGNTLLPDPLLVVMDSSSGRKLVFHPNASGYVGSVDAPETSGNTPHTHTALVWDGNGHAQQINVYTGDGTTLLHQDLFSYGGPNGDSITGSTQGVTSSAFSYVTDSFVPDGVNLPVPRLSSATYGSGSDTRSSDDGTSIQGTYRYTYGPLQTGYNHGGAAARTNTTTDPKGNVFSTLFNADPIQQVINSLTYAGPDFTGATYNSNSDYTAVPTGSNVVAVSASPNIDQPTQVKVYDALYNLGLSSHPWQVEYDPYGNVIGFQDPLTHSWGWTYNVNGTELTSVSDPTLATITFGWGENSQPASRLTSITDPAGAQAQLLYNSFGQPLSITVPATYTPSGAASVTGLSYASPTGDLASVTYPTGDILTVNSYDALGDPLSVSLFPDTGNPTTSHTPLTSTIAYDAAQMPTLITDAAGVSLKTTFTNGVATQYTVLNQGATQAQMNLSYDSRGRLYAASDLMGMLEQIRYDKNSNPTRILDGNGNTTRFAFGANNEFTGLTWPDGQSLSLLYDDAGRVRQLVDERGVVVNYVYDAAYRLTDIHFPADSGQNVHYTYDDAGRVLSVTDSTGSRTYTYDHTTHRLQQVTTVYSGLPAGSNTFTVSYTYYPDSHVASMTSPAGTTNYFYDIGGRLSSLTDPLGNTTSWSRDHSGRIIAQSTSPTGGVAFITTYSWGPSNQSNDPSTAPAYLSNVQQTVNGQLYWNFWLRHNFLGQVTYQKGQGYAANQISNESFDYDTRGRLSDESIQFQPDLADNFVSSSVYSYDPANNLSPRSSTPWTFNSSNQVTQAAYQALAAPDLGGATGLSYDHAGNTLTLYGWTLSYSSWGELGGISLSGNGNAVYTYDSAGRRVSKTYGGVTTYYLYEGDRLLCEIGGNGALTRSYSWGRCGLISDLSGNQSRFYLFDAIANLRALYQANGTQLWQGDWSGWGTRVGPSSPPTPFGRKGQYGAYLDSESGFVRMGARYYSPNLGRFLTRDPAGFAAGANLYAYCAGDPINFFDPTGCDPQDIGGRLGSIAGGAALGFVGGGPLGAVFGALAGNSLYDSAQNAGQVQGEHDGGKASAWDVAGAYGRLGLDAGAVAFPVLGRLGSEVEAAEEAEAAAQALKGPKCFVAGTPVWVMEAQEHAASVAKGKSGKACAGSGSVNGAYLKAIETVKAGDQVLARNLQTGKTEVKRVLRTTIKQAQVVVKVSLAEAKGGKVVEVLTSSREHPYFVRGKGFVPAGGLAVGNAILTRAGPDLVVARVEWLRRVEGYKVYNFVVEDDHSYFVGTANGGAWVHNPIEYQLNLFPDDPALEDASAKGGTYLLVDPETNQIVRTGRTNDLARRLGEHSRDPELAHLEFMVDKYTDDFAAQRGREQIIHEMYNPPFNEEVPLSRKHPDYHLFIHAGSGL